MGTSRAWLGGGPLSLPMGVTPPLSAPDAPASGVAVVASGIAVDASGIAVDASGIAVDASGVVPLPASFVPAAPVEPASLMPAAPPLPAIPTLPCGGGLGTSTKGPPGRRGRKPETHPPTILPPHPGA